MASLAPEIDRLSAILRNPSTSDSDRNKALDELNSYTKKMTNDELAVVTSLARPLFMACDQPLGNAASSSYADNQRTWLLDAEPALWDRGDFSVDLCKENFGGIFMSVGTMLSGRSFRAEAREATCMAQFVAKSVSALEHNIFQDLCSADNVCVELGQPTIINSRPDMVWLANGTPVLVHEHKASRSFPLRPASVPANAVRGDLLSCYYETYGEAVRKPVAQIYGYMVVMGLKYGVLSTTEFTWFLRRPDGPESPALEITDAFSCTDSGEHSVNMAYTQMLLMAIHDDDSVGQFPRDLDSGLGQLVLNKRAEFIGSQHARGRARWISRSDGASEWVKGIHAGYQARQRGASSKRHAPDAQTKWDSGTGVPLSASEFGSILPLPWSADYTVVSESERFSVKRLRLQNGVCIIMKTLVVRDAEEPRTDSLCRETESYTALEALQGVAIVPLVYGGFVGPKSNCWQVVATVDLGTNLECVAEKRRKTLKKHARWSLQQLHARGFLHGDVALRNFVVPDDSGRVFLIDLESSRPCNQQQEFDAELSQFDSLF